MEDQKLVTASVIALAVTLFAIFSIRPMARRFGLVDRPDQRKRHRGCVPLIGGLCFFLGTLVGLFYLGYLDRFVTSLMAGAALIVVVGVLDDLNGLSVRARLLAEAGAIGLVIAASGYYIDDLGPLFGESTRLGLLGIPLTIVAVIGLINAFNMLDGVDGLAGSVAMVTIAAILVFSDAGLYAPGILLMLQVLFAAMIPYLFVNLGWPDGRKVFMGDAGSMLIGFLIAWSLIYLSRHEVGRMAPVDVLWCVALPIMDTIAVMYRRARKGLSIFKPDRQHLHHLLLDNGFSPRAVLLTMVLATGFLAMFGYALRNAPDLVSVTAFVAILAAYAFWMPQIKLDPPGKMRRRSPHSPAAPSPGAAPLALEHVPAREPATAAQADVPLKALCLICAPSETITIAPIAQQIAHDDRFESTVCVAARPGQDTEDVLQLFDIQPDLKLELDRAGAASDDGSLAALGQMKQVLAAVEPDMVLVPADALAGLATTLAAYQQHIPVVCVETRGTDADDASVKIVRKLASLHMTSSHAAHRSLIEEGVPEDRILVAGNTAIDTLHAALEQLQHDIDLNRKLALRYPFLRADSPLLLVVSNPDAADMADATACALRDVAARRPDVDIVCIFEPDSPDAGRVDTRLGGLAHAHTIEASDYMSSVYLMRIAHVIVASGDPGAEVIEIGNPVVIVGAPAPADAGARAHVRQAPAEPAEIARQALALLEQGRSASAQHDHRRREDGEEHRPFLDALARVRPAATQHARRQGAAQPTSALAREQT